MIAAWLEIASVDENLPKAKWRPTLDTADSIYPFATVKAVELNVRDVAMIQRVWISYLCQTDIIHRRVVGILN